MSRPKVVALLLLLLGLRSQGYAQPTQKVWVLLRDKGIREENFHSGNPNFDSVLNHLTPECIARRETALDVHESAEVVSIEDAPIAPDYLDSLRSLGITPLQSSRWTNAVSATITEIQYRRLKSCDWVRGILPVARGVFPEPLPSSSDVARKEAPTQPTSALNVLSDVLPDTLAGHYGGSQSQLDRIDVPPLHRLGFDATGVRLGFLDTGFRWRAIDALNGRNVISEYDYVFHDSVTANQAEDMPHQDEHGTAVFSAAAGLLPDTLIGPAYNATIMLAKTEDGRSETPREEDNYAAALESMEANGIQLTTSSLGYLGFDSGFVSYTYNDLNGHTAICTRAVQRAEHLGLLCLNAMGNSGATGFPYMLTPADADSILSVGALDVDDSISSFSSRGPTVDGRRKPEICAPGVSVWLATVDGGFFSASGTSYATPLTAGSCALIMQAHPEATAQSIRSAILATGVRLHQPDTAFGWGRLDALAAALQLGTVIGPPRVSAHDSIAQIRVGVAANNMVKSVTMIYGLGATSPLSYRLTLAQGPDSLHYSGGLSGLPGNTVVRYVIEAVDGADTLRYLPRDPSNHVFTFTTGTGSVNVRPTIVARQLFMDVAPNPAFDHAQLRFDFNPGGSIGIIDGAGREVEQFTTFAGQHTLELPLNALAAGDYFVRFLSASPAHLPIAQTKLTVLK